MMNVPESTCSRAAIEQFLADQLSGPELIAFEDHLENCPSCRASLDNLAAESQWWDEARLYLSAAQDRVTPVSNRHHETADETEQTLFGLKSYLAPTDDPRMLGRLGPYEIVGIIGCGGMGIVLKAFDGPLNRTVAIKVLGPHLALNPMSRQRFAREAKAAATVVNLNVIAIHSVAEANGLPYFVMPYVRGPSLEKRLRDGNAFSVVEILRIGMQIASGLAAAHAQGVVHRDIKPANIMLEEGIERVTITDFGLARAADDTSMTQSGVVAGTPQYMSPEQARGDAVDPRSDLFSLGSVLYALCTGQPPFQSATTMGVLKRVEECRPRPVRALNPEIPELLARIIERLHAKEPSERFQSAGEVAAFLEGYLAHLGQPETVPAPEMASVAKKTGRKMVGRLMSFTPSLLVLMALGFGVVTWFAAGGTRISDKEVVNGAFQKDYAQEYYQSFKGEPLDKDAFTLRGNPEGIERIKYEPDGLRITLPAGYPAGNKGTGLILNCTVKGDFEITLSFENLKGPAQSTAQNRDARMSLGASLDMAGNNEGAVTQIMNGRGGIQYSTYLSVNNEEKVNGKRLGEYLPPEAKVERLRLVRAGAELFCYGTQGEITDFTFLVKHPFRDFDLKNVYFAARSGGPKSEIDVRVTELRIRADFVRKGQTRSSLNNFSPRARGRNVVWVLAFLFVLTVVIAGLWVFVRRRRKKELTADTSEQIQSNSTESQ